MKSIITAVLAAASLVGFASAETVTTTATEDLLDNLGTGASQFSVLSKSFSTSDSDVSGITAESVSAWLADDGGTLLRWTGMNGGTAYAASPVLDSTENGYTLAFVNRAAHKGSVVGLSSTISADLDTVTSLTFTYTFTSQGESITSQSGTSPLQEGVYGRLALVYQTEGDDGETVWTMAYYDFVTSYGGEASVTVTDALAGSTVYAVIATTNQANAGGTATTGHISLTAAYTTTTEVADPSESGTVPEPATATLSLLALAGLAARRRRK